MSKTQNNQKNNMIKEMIEYVEKKDLDTPHNVVLNIGNGKELIIKIKKSIPFTEKIELTNDIVNTIFMGENNNIDDFQPFLINFAKEYGIVSHYVCDLELPTDVNAAWKFLVATNLFELVNQNVGKEITQILEEVNLMIKSKLDSLVHNNGVRDFIKRLDGFLDGLSKTFDNINLEEMMGILQKIPTNISEKTIVDTIINDANLAEKIPD